MSQNYSNMSNIYIPELIALDSYWQKAVQDAIYDTLKGEKRLYYALKNRKNINKKLERLGLKPAYTQMSFSRRYHFNNKTKEKKNCFSKYVTNKKCDLCKENSLSSMESDKNDYTDCREKPYFSIRSLSDVGKRSKIKPYREQTPEKNYKNPERPLLGDGSLEKMKKSQNSFNYFEPMGKEFLSSFSESEEEEEKEKKEEKEEEKMPYKEAENNSKFLKDEKNKKIECLHVRDGSAFEESDTEMTHNVVSKEVIEKNGLQKKTTVKNMNCFLNKKLNYSTSNNVPKSENSQNECQKIPVQLNTQENLLWENKVENTIKENADLERNLLVALAKREIISEGRKSLKMVESGNKIQISSSAAKNPLQRKKRQLLSPFVKFYLEVYRELWHKFPVKEIAVEAAKRWRDMSMKQKLTYSGKNSNKQNKMKS